MSHIHYHPSTNTGRGGAVRELIASDVRGRGLLQPGADIMYFDEPLSDHHSAKPGLLRSYPRFSPTTLIPAVKRTTMATVAKAAGVHISTVSRALSGDPHIPKTTSEKVRRIAKKVGYRPDPILSALNAYRRRTQPMKFTATMAGLVVGWSRQEWQQQVIMRRYWEGASRKAEMLGYRLEMFFLDSVAISGERLARILHARNISGLLVFPLKPPFELIGFPFHEFATVAFGFSLINPSMHRVTCQHFAAITLTLERLHALGYRRPALVLPRLPVRRLVLNVLRGAYLTEGAYWFRDFTPLIYTARADDPENFAAWFSQARPDVIISQVHFISDLLEAAQLTVPDDVAVAYQIVDDFPDAAGIDQQSHAIGERAVELLARMLMDHEIGLPDIATHTLVEPRWQDGKTAPACHPADLGVAIGTADTY